MVKRHRPISAKPVAHEEFSEASDTKMSNRTSKMQEMERSLVNLRELVGQV